MPQMAPLSWLLMFFFFLLIFMLFNIMNYYFYIYKIKFIKNNKFLISYNWKW
uniref:ATP synthase F0 subunit 8 n=1 Tax=Arctolamia fruhstorferi TaxID=3109542 RepID=UPI002E7A745C|nr:ATP synthase F0 subunit 8 [Arctolamia fruhstorferi]WQM87507.1 ATP synthase F0 subunit 8 [Arctolamia fruhstorferi]